MLHGGTWLVEESPLSSCLSASAYCTVLPQPMRAVCAWKQLGAAGDAAEARTGGSPPARCCRRAGDLRCWQRTDRRICGNAFLSFKLHPMEPVSCAPWPCQPCTAAACNEGLCFEQCIKCVQSPCRWEDVANDNAHVARRQALLAVWLHQADDNVPSMLSLLGVAANEGAAVAWSSDRPGRMHVQPLVRWLPALVNGAPLARSCVLHVKPGRLHSLPRQTPSGVATVQPLDTPNGTAAGQWCPCHDRRRGGGCTEGAHRRGGRWSRPQWRTPLRSKLRGFRS